MNNNIFVINLYQIQQKLFQQVLIYPPFRIFFLRSQGHHFFQNYKKHP